MLLCLFTEVFQQPTGTIFFPHKEFSDVIRGNRRPNRAMMDFNAPIVDWEPEIEITMEDIESEVEYWKAGLIQIVVGLDLSMNAMKTYIDKVWNFVYLPATYYLEKAIL